jgi:hypothetical protein
MRSRVGQCVRQSGVPFQALNTHLEAANIVPVVHDQLMHHGNVPADRRKLALDLREPLVMLYLAVFNALLAGAQFPQEIQDDVPPVSG